MTNNVCLFGQALNSQTAPKMIYFSLFKFVSLSFLESSSKAWVSDMTKSLLQKERTNVLVVDWGKGALSFVTGGNSRLVGAQVAYLLKKIFQQSSIVDKNVHIIGFSLGAHVAGFAGKRLIKDGYKLGRITGK